MDTKEIINNFSVTTISDKDKHLARLADLYGEERLKGQFYLREFSRSIIDWKERGFAVVVPVKMIDQFCYHGNIKYPGIKTHRGQEIYYNGDIPDFALDKINHLGGYNNTYITIHSNQKLPLKIKTPSVLNRFIAHINLTFTDPVMIAWDRDPKITLHAFTGKPIGYNIGSYGVVIAIWGKEGEPL